MCVHVSLQDFAKWLLQVFPHKPTLDYVDAGTLPAVPLDNLAQEKPFKVHVSSFSFLKTASLKMPPGRSLTLQLVDEITTDGFISSGEPLQARVRLHLVYRIERFTSCFLYSFLSRRMRGCSAPQSFTCGAECREGRDMVMW